MTDPLQDVLDRLEKVSKTARCEWTARCPAHDDTTPSLSIAEGDDQPVVFHCHAGCTSEDIVEALSMDWGRVCEGGASKSEFERAPWEHGQEVAAYEYVDAEGEHLYTVKRYEHPERGWKSFRPYLPGNFKAGLGTQERVLYRLPDVIDAAEKGRVVFVVEGEKDVYTLEERGLTATTSGSAGSWDDDYAQALSGARVVVLPDSDPEGREYAEEVAQSCFPTAEWVRVLDLEDVPQGGDVTDWFARGHEKAELIRRIEDAGDWEPGPSIAESGARGDGAHTPEPERPTGWEEVRRLYTDREKGQARLEAAKQAIDDRAFTARRESGHLYVWSDQEHVYSGDGAQALSEHLVRQIGKHHSRHEVQEISAKIAALSSREEFGAPCIPVTNGDLDIADDGSSVDLLDADPERGPLARSPAEWDPDAECPVFNTHLKKVCPDEKERKTLQEYAGYSLLHWRMPHHKALFFVGPTASGKSTTLDAIRSIMGAVSNLQPQQLVNGRFGAGELEGAWVNIRADVSSSLLKDIGLFKELIAGDPIFIERKHEQGYTIEPTAKHMYSANRLPDLEIDDDAFFRRILMVSFPKTIDKEERDPQLPALLETEKSGILRWAVEGLARVLGNDGFSHDRPPDETRHRWNARASSIGRFKALQLRVTGDSGHWIPKQDAYSEYTAFCNEEGLSAESQTQFTQTLKGDPNITDAKRTPPGESAQVGAYVGVQMEGDEGIPF